MLDNIRIVLVRTFHPGNIGSAARAMKTMGLTELALVNPVDFPSDDALKMAVSAADVVQNATVYSSLFDAVSDCHVVVASTARSRGFDLPVVSPEESAKLLYASAKHSSKPVALVFGPERMGLSNEDLSLATHRVTIPTNPDYSSLNMAAAVQTLTYEIFKQHSHHNGLDTRTDVRERPSMESIEVFYQQLEAILTETGFIFKNHPGKIMQKFRRLFARAEMDKSELKMVHGAFASLKKAHKLHEKCKK